MVTYNLHPPTGIGPVRIGMSREKVRQVMPEPPQLFNTRGCRGPAGEAYHGGAFLVHYGKQPEMVVYIEVPGSAGVRLVCGDLDIFESQLESVLEAFNKKAAKLAEGLWYSFPELQLMLILPAAEEKSRTFVWSVGVGEHPVYEPEP